MTLWYWLAAGLVATALGFGGGWQVRGWRADADQAEVVQSLQEGARLAEKARLAKATGVDDATTKRLRQAADAADGARSELERLRATLALGDDGAPAVCASVSARAAQVSQLLGECSGRYQAVARDADRYAQQLTGWQSLIPEPAPESTP